MESKGKDIHTYLVEKKYTTDKPWARNPENMKEIISYTRKMKPSQ